MKQRWHCLLSWLFPAILALTGAMTGGLARAQAAPRVLSYAPAGASVTILVLDMSGSMSTNDPAGVRCSAANAYIDLSGPGDVIGVVGLDSQGTGTDAHHFQDAVVWAQPTEMATLTERQQLQQVIASKSHDCHPDNTTPTYDALAQAEQMLTSATDGGRIPGSVVLLTDGVPAPDTGAQIDAIHSDLLPQFRQSHWPIDAIALGADAPVPGSGTTFHGFLSGLSDATSGAFYDDSHGVIPGVSPLNIADFFVKIFAQNNQRIVATDIPPTGLDGSTTRRNFSVTDYTRSLDVVVVKDQAATTASLVTPDGQSIAQNGSGVFVSAADPHYIIFSITSPQAGLWEVDVSGSGQFLMDSLKTSGIGLSTIAASQAGLTTSAHPVLALGQPVTVSANLTNDGQPVTDDRFTLSGTITSIGGSGQYNQAFSLNDRRTPGTYIGQVTVPAGAPPGSYRIVLLASSVSAVAVVARQSLQLRIERFPLPALDEAQATAVQWDPLLRLLYGLPFWPMPQLGLWALSGLPDRGVTLSGLVQQNQQPYSGATLTALAQRKGTPGTVPVAVITDGAGRFHLLLDAPADGTYLLTFRTSGSFAESHGDFGMTGQTVQVTLTPATLGEELHAWVFTLGYLALLLLLLGLLNWGITARPQGSWQRYRGGEEIQHSNFWPVARNPWRGFLHRNWLSSQQARMPAGVLFRFRHGGGLEARASGRGSGDWRWSDGRGLPEDFREVRELVYRPRGSEEDEEVSRFAFAVQSQASQRGRDDNRRERGAGSRESRRRSSSTRGGGRARYREDETLFS